jgi:transcriptional regulator with XRE-family HTH domain
MVLGDRLRKLREQKKLSQRDIVRRTGVSRSTLSKVENGQSVPGVETLEKIALALEVPIYRLFYKGKVPRKFPNLSSRETRKTEDDILWGSKGNDRRLLLQFCRLFGRMKEADRKRLFFIAQKLVPSELRRSSPKWREWLMISRSAEKIF